MTPEDERRFRSQVRADASGCVLWTGSSRPNRYGRFFIRRRAYLAHRLAWELANGPIPDGLMVLHRCDNPPCVNPEHLFLGTHADNMADKQAKGRQARGDRHGSRTHPESRLRGEAWHQRHGTHGPRGEQQHLAKLTEAAVRVIRRDDAGGIPRKVLAARYGVSWVCIWNVVTRRTWKHVA